MHNYIYQLQIALPKGTYVNQVSEIIGVTPDHLLNRNGYLWILENKIESGEAWIDYISQYCSFLNRAIGDLASLGISSEDISIWKLYEYDGQCNMEFEPQQMKLMGDLGVKFCISCWLK